MLKVRSKSHDKMVHYHTMLAIHMAKKDASPEHAMNEEYIREDCRFWRMMVRKENAEKAKNGVA